VLQQPPSYSEALLTLLSSPTLASKEWVYKQYDHMVQTNTVTGPGADAAVIRLKGSKRALAMTVDGNSTYCLLNPYYGGAITVAEAARNLVCVGAKPIALSDCLNFANPEKPETMWHFSACIEGMVDACERFKIPVVSGNVSFYNETLDQGIYPTPVIGMVGLIKCLETPLTPGFKDAGEHIILIGETLEELGGTVYLKEIHSQERGYPPVLNFEKEKAVQDVVLSAAEAGILTAAHDCSEGGLAVALADCCLLSESGVGAIIKLQPQNIRMDGILFSESQSRILVTVKEAQLAELLTLLEEGAVPYSELGLTGGDRLDVSLENKTIMRLPILKMRAAHSGGLKNYFEKNDSPGSR